MFVSPVAYAVLSLFAALSGLFFVLSVAAYNMRTVQLRQFQAFEQLEMMNLNEWLIAGFYQTMAFIMVFLIPAVTMGLFVSEKTNGTQELLMTSPITVWDIVFGKFAAAAIFVGILVAMVGAYPGLLFVYGNPEVGKTLTGLLSVLLVGWTYVAVGVFASSVTRSQVVSFLVAMVLLLFMMLAPAAVGLGAVAGVEGVGEVFRWLSSEEHSMNLMEGLVDSADLVYFVVIIGSFLLMTRAAVDSSRWR
jgi:ABC-2 type transport system permease protein